jgi:hypothetical protein
MRGSSPYSGIHGLSSLAAGGHHGDAVLDLLSPVLFGQHGLEVAHKSIHTGQFGVQVHLKTFFGVST